MVLVETATVSLAITVMELMGQSTLSNKLLIKPGQTLTILNAPAGFEQMLEPLPTGAKLSHRLQSGLGAVLLFVRNVGELEQWGTKVTKAMAHDGLLWRRRVRR
jgi:hypothetical protein